MKSRHKTPILLQDEIRLKRDGSVMKARYSWCILSKSRLSEMLCFDERSGREIKARCPGCILSQSHLREIISLKRDCLSSRARCTRAKSEMFMCSLSKSRLSEIISLKRDHLSSGARYQRAKSEIQWGSLSESRLSEMKSLQARFAWLSQILGPCLSPSCTNWREWGM